MSRRELKITRSSRGGRTRLSTRDLNLKRREVRLSSPRQEEVSEVSPSSTEVNVPAAMNMPIESAEPVVEEGVQSVAQDSEIAEESTLEDATQTEPTTKFYESPETLIQNIAPVEPNPGVNIKETNKTTTKSTSVRGKYLNTIQSSFEPVEEIDIRGAAYTEEKSSTVNAKDYRHDLNVDNRITITPPSAKEKPSVEQFEELLEGDVQDDDAQDEISIKTPIAPDELIISSEPVEASESIKAEAIEGLESEKPKKKKFLFWG